MSRTDRLALVLSFSLSLGVPGCVLVSSTSRVPPSTDAGVDAPPRPPRDAQPIDAPEQPVLTREEATRRLLEDLGANVFLPTYRELAARAAALETATAAYAASRSDADRDAARAAWIAAMETVERAELLQLGPAGMAVPEILGGRGLRDAIYTFPTNRCLASIVVEQRTYDDLATLAAQPAFARGMGAIEYLLFYEGGDHGCDPAGSPRVDDAVWDALGADGVRQRRAEAAHASAQLVRDSADALVSAWAAGKGDFAGQLARAGESGSVYPTSQAALNAIYWALYYLDRAIKDMKLGIPTGLNMLCPGTSCPGLVESRYAHRSAEHLAANLVAVQEIFLGGPAGTEAIGFDDLLRAIGQDELATEMALAISDGVAAAQALPSVDPSSFEEHEPALEAMHASVQAIASLLKGQFAGVLALTPPPGAGEDND